MHVLTCGTRLNSASWSKAVQATGLDLARLETPGGLAGEHVHVDMSEVGFADFVTIGHVLVFLRAAIDAGAPYSLRWPEQGLLAGESAHDPDAALRKLQRHNCRLYLQQSGFAAVLRELPQAAQEVGPHATGPVVPPPPTVERLESQRLPQRQRKILPYRWVRAADAQGITRSSHTASLETALRDLGLSSEDSAALGKGVLAELLENAAEHSGSEVILLGGAIVPHEAYGARIDDFDACLGELMDSAWQAESALVRLVVADLGRGLLGATAPPGGEVRAILETLDRRSVSPGAREGGHGARGLWKVSRIIRSYGGSLLMTTGGWTPCRSFANGSTSGDSGHPAAVAMPGTFVECAILSHSGEAPPLSADQALTPVRQPTDSRHNLSCVSVTLHVGEGIEGHDVDLIRATLAGLPTDTSGLVIVATIPDGADAPDDVEIGASVRQVLEIAGETGTLAPIALAFPSINRPLMAVAIEDLNSGVTIQKGNECPPATRYPVLVLAPENRHFWVGGTTAMRQVLRRLSSSDGPLRVGELIDGSGLGPAVLATAIRALRDHTNLLHCQQDEVSLQLLPHDVVEALSRFVAEEMRRCIDTPEGSGVWHGAFLTPNLRLTSRWLDFDELLTRLRLHGLAGFALAARIADRLGRFEDMPSRPLIVRVGSAPREMVSALARSLNGRDEFYEVFDDPRLERAARRLAAPARVLLVGDMVSGGRTITRALTEAIDREMVPIGVAVVADARETESIRTEPDDLTFQALRVPLISLARVDVEVRGEVGTVAAIDPVHRRPVLERDRQQWPLVSQSAYVAAVKRNGAARLGHMERPASRHYTAYVDPTVLFREPDWTTLALARIARKVRLDHAQAFPADADDAWIAVLHPVGTADDLPAVAGRLAERLREAGLGVADVVGVPRVAFGPHWRLPDSLHTPSGIRHAVIIDSATSSGNTMRQMIRLAADEVEAVTCVLLLNGLNEGDAVTLQQTAAVHRRQAPLRGGAEAVRVNIHYVARTAVSGIDVRECDICKLRKRYQAVSPHTPMPAKLGGHRDWLLRTLEPRTKQTMFAEQATDLFGAHVSQADCVAYLLWRFELREAAVKTMSRQALYDKLCTQTGDLEVRDALIRLLVAESHWLESAPLWFPDCRLMLGDMTLSLLTSEDALAIEQMLLVQAVIVLAMTAPQLLAEHLVRIVQANRHQPPVVLQVLLEVHCLIAGLTLPTARARDVVTQSMVHNLKKLEKSLRDPAGRSTDTTIYVNIVRYLLSHGRRVLQPVPTDPQVAWAALRDHHSSVADHNYDNAMWRIGLAVNLIDRGHPPEDLEGIRDDWEMCSNFLIYDLLPNIQALRGPLSSDKLTHELSPGDAVRWWQILRGEGPEILDGVRGRLDELLSDAEAERLPASPNMVAGLVEDLDWWNRLFLRPSTAGALLHQMMARCPTDMRRVLRDTFKDASVTTEPADVTDPLLVFCADRTLKDVFTHVRRNAEETHRAGVEELTFHIEIDDTEGAEVVVTVCNTDSAPAKAGGGNGLDALRYELERFQGRIAEHGPADQPWTYRIVVALQRWEMPQ